MPQPDNTDKPSLAERLATELVAIWLAVRDPRTPMLAKIAGWLVVAYAVSPIDLIPDFIPVIGLLDDALIVPAGLWLVERLTGATLMAEFRAAARQGGEHPAMRWGALIVLGLWAALLLAALYGWHVAAEN